MRESGAVMDEHIEELAKLQELREHGTITEDEFVELKNRLIHGGSPASGAPTLVPPPPPAKKSRKAAFIVAGAAVVAVAGVVVFLVSRGDSKLPPVGVTYTIEVVTTEPCEDFSDTGYGDIPFAEAEVVDGSGNLLGFGTLDGGVDTDTSCIFTAVFEIDRSPDGKYRATAGNTNRGYINYTESDVKNGKLLVDAIIGE